MCFGTVFCRAHASAWEPRSHRTSSALRLAAPLLALPRRGRGPARRREPRRPDPGGGRDLVRALLSVSDKRGIVELARELVALGWEIVSTGGAARAPRQGGGAGAGVRDDGK